MNKKMENTFTSLIAVAILFIVTACQCSTNSIGDLFKSSKGNSSSNSSDTGTIEVPSQNSKSSTDADLASAIIGTWEMQPDRRVKFIFTSNGEITVDEGEGAKTAKYKVIDEETIEIQPPGQSAVKRKIKISGDTMTMEDRGKTLNLRKVSSPGSSNNRS